MGYFIEQGEYELLFAEYNSIEEKAENMIDAYKNATSVNQMKIYISFSKIQTAAELQSHMENIL
jgi:hypothetical protein